MERETTRRYNRASYHKNKVRCRNMEVPTDLLIELLANVLHIWSMLTLTNNWNQLTGIYNNPLSRFMTFHTRQHQLISTLLLLLYLLNKEETLGEMTATISCTGFCLLLEFDSEEEPNRFKLGKPLQVLYKTWIRNRKRQHQGYWYSWHNLRYINKRAQYLHLFS